MTVTSTLKLEPLPSSTIAGAPKADFDSAFGRVATGVDLNNLSEADTAAIQDALYRHSVLLFPGWSDAEGKLGYVKPEAQYELTRSFDPSASGYGHGKERQKSSILHPDLKTLPECSAVQLIGNGPVASHEGLVNVQLKHPHHKTFHDTVVSDVDEEEAGATRFYRWHIDAALYDLHPPKVTSLYGITMPVGKNQTVRYDDGSNETLPVSQGTTAFVSGAQMFDELSPARKSLAVRTTVTYAPHPYVWMKDARSNSLGLGLVSQGKELQLDQLPDWQESKIQRLPMCWKNPVTGRLHLQVHPSAIMELSIAPLSTPASPDSFYPEGASITDLAEVRTIVLSLQRASISPAKVYAHDWQEGDFCLFHNRGVLHTVVGAFRPDEVRMFHQCNLAGSETPAGPDADDRARYML